MDSALYGLAGDVAVVRPTPEEMEYIHAEYLELLEKGAGTQEQHRNLTSIAHTLRQRDKVESIILAGTDLSLLFNEANTEFPHVDCAALHLERILNEMLGKTPGKT